MAKTILQWNCRGIKPNRNELSYMSSKYNIAIFCLQETFLKQPANFELKGYTSYHQICESITRAKGGVSLLVDKRLPQSRINLNTTLQAVAASVTLNKTYTICSLYISPNEPLEINKLYHLIEQLPKPFLILGDFNAHSTSWGCRNSSNRGKQLEEFILKNDICLLNNNSSTHICPRTGSQSTIDLSICSPSLQLEFTHTVLEDSHGSDHLPILLKQITQNNTKTTKWNFNKANWIKFKDLCTKNLQNVETMETFTEVLYQICEETIPRSTTIPNKPRKPWFTEECKKAIKDREKALKALRRNPDYNNLEFFRLCRAKARRTIKKSKRDSWQNYISKLNIHTPTTKVWEMIKKIKGKQNTPSISHLYHNGNKITDLKDICNLLAETFSTNSSGKHYSEEFLKHKNKTEKIPLDFSTKLEEHYNKRFSMTELMNAIQKSNNSAAGPDDIHYEIIRQLPESVLETLLNIYNYIWEEEIFPVEWKMATIIPIPKPEKDPMICNNYRPIALTSCLCKIQEKMINERLIWYLETNHIINIYQSGFRKGRSTLDHLIRFETFVRDALIRNQHMVSVFFDLEKAYDTTWKYGIMKDLQDIGMKGHLPIFIANFLNDRRFRVRIGSTYSDLYAQEMGVPQGSILSVTLFSLKINNIIKAISPNIKCSLYVDDFQICYGSSSMITIERVLQNTLDKLWKWSNENGFKFSTSKTVCMHFCRQRPIHPDPVLKLNGKEIPVVQQTKFLGLIIDKKMNFEAHIEYLRKKCLKSLNLLKIVSNTTWGADRTIMLRMYRSLIRSKLDYGCQVYGAARQKPLKYLDTVQNSGLRLCLGAFRTSPIESMHVEAKELPIRLRRRRLSILYALKLRSNPQNPANRDVFYPQHTNFYKKKSKAIKPFGQRIKEDLKKLKINQRYIAKQKYPKTPPWEYVPPQVNFSLNELNKKNTDQSIFRSNLQEILENYNPEIQIYTDGSKSSNGQVACAMYTKEKTLSTRLPDNSTVFSAELTAIKQALKYIKTSKHETFMILSDSLSSLQAIDNEKWDNPIIQSILELNQQIFDETDKFVDYCWIPGHTGIKGNEEADKAAKEALELKISDNYVPHKDFKEEVDKYFIDTWQNIWSEQKDNKLFQIQPIVNQNQRKTKLSKQEKSTLTRLRLGHTHLTHSHLLKGEPAPKCECGHRLTIGHILIHCKYLTEKRKSSLPKVNTVKELFQTANEKDILDFIKRSGFYNRI